MSISLDNQNFCFIGRNSILKGDLQLDGPGHISGKVIGNIKSIEKYKLAIEPSSIIEGSIDAHDIDIYGMVNGDITASGKLCIYPSATVKGKINASSLVIKPGSNVNIIGHTLES